MTRISWTILTLALVGCFEKSDDVDPDDTGLYNGDGTDGADGTGGDASAAFETGTYEIQLGSPATSGDCDALEGFEAGDTDLWAGVQISGDDVDMDLDGMRMRGARAGGSFTVAGSLEFGGSSGGSPGGGGSSGGSTGSGSTEPGTGTGGGSPPPPEEDEPYDYPEVVEATLEADLIGDNAFEGELVADYHMASGVTCTLTAPASGERTGDLEDGWGDDGEEDGEDAPGGGTTTEPEPA